ncbi:Cyclic di-GMP phosphodiesterase [Methylophilaceae bacterium]|nr:Cyclic di-GMP phosphodiesterase [Methylophilaceae bacterium]
MLKRIAVDDLRLGMFVEELCGSWLDHPFWRSSFVIEDPRDIQRIQESSVRELWIDVSKGLDVESKTASAQVVQNTAAVDQMLASANNGLEQKNNLVRIPAVRERIRARKILANSKTAVSSMFKEARLGKALQAADAIPLVEEISGSVSRNPGALISLARLKTKDDYTYMHSVAVCALMIALAREMDMSAEDVREAGMAGLLHDIGKMAIPLGVLNKPGKLTDEEFFIVKNHPVAGHEMLTEANGVSDITLDVCLHHHEKVDGSGYPHKLAGDQISKFAKMGAVCDIYDAITSDRPYKKGWTPGESLRKMAEWSKGHFDPLIFQAFVKSVGIYPIGSLVRLESHRLAVVIDQSESSLLTPVVKVFFSIKSNTRILPTLLDLSRPSVNDRVVSHENPEKWKITDLDEVMDSANLEV